MHGTIGRIALAAGALSLLLLLPGRPAIAGSDATRAAAQVVSGVTELTPADLAAGLSKKDFWLVNVHIPYEGEIEGTDAFIPYDRIAADPGALPKDKGAKIVVYCRSGRMSAIAARELMRLGYSRVSDLAGGMIDWEKAGNRIIAK
jgi:rhodanese-related sulfurtransferase